jgi:hypothetical protein
MADDMPKHHMQIVEPPIPYKQQRKPRGGGGSGGDKALGFGNIRPIGVSNIFNKGGLRIPYTLKWQKYLDVNFAKEEHPFIIPYQTLSFWTGIWDTEANTQNIIARDINEQATGVEFIDSTLTIEVYAVTRQRLLQTGATNVQTFDMETSEGLHITITDRDVEPMILKDIHSCGPLASNTYWAAGYHAHEDSYTKLAIIPHHYKWSRTFPWPRPGHGYLWELPRTFDARDTYTTLMPGAQGLVQWDNSNGISM